MKFLFVAVAAVSMMVVSGCEVRETRVSDPHRVWWEERHRQEAYERERAEREHRDWCVRNPDRSCEGWR